MARYTGPKTKKARSFGEPIFGYDKAYEKRTYGPGQHGNSRRRRQKSEYGVQLAEKQKAKYTYGILERQFLNYYKKATRKSGVTGEVLLQLLEARLDNTVFRLGMAPTRAAARQLVSHKHVTVNGEVANIPSYHLNAGDIISIRNKSIGNKNLVVNIEQADRQAFPWLEWEASTFKGTYLNEPERTDIPENIKEQLIVELYSK